MRVLLDSNSMIEHDWWLAGGSAEALLSASSRQSVRVIVPQIVIDEVVAKFSERLSKAQRDAERAWRLLARLVPGTSEPEFPHVTGSDYGDELVRRLTNADVVIEPYSIV